MPTADQIEWPQDEPLFEVHWRAISEGLIGNGVKDAGDFEVTATANNREVSIAAGTAFYQASESTLGSSTTKTHSAGDGSNDRWDIIAYDTGTDSVTKREGTAAANPEPPDIQGDEILLAVIKVPQNFDAPFDNDTHIFNWRTFFSNEAEHVNYDDSTGVYSVNNVDAALDELQEAAQIGAYPLALADLANPFGLDELTDMDVDATDLTDGATVLYESSNGWLRNEVVQALRNFTGDEAFTGTHPLPLGDLASPFALPSITDMDAAGNDLVDGGTTVWDTSEGHVPRGSLDDVRATTTVTSASYTTSDEEVVFVDTATIGGASTITLASADAVDGNAIRIMDVAGSAKANPITVDTEGSETIDGDSSITIDTDYNAYVLISDGTNWKIQSALAAESRGPPEEDFSGSETGNVPAGDTGVLVVSSLEPNESVEVYRAALTTDTIEAIPTGIDLKLVTFDNAGGFTTQATLITGDGSTVFDDETGDPLGSYENTGTSAESIGVVADNTTTSAQELVAMCEGRTGL